VEGIKAMQGRLLEHSGMLKLGIEEGDSEIIREERDMLLMLFEEAKDLQLKLSLNGKNDKGPCFIHVVPGTGGLEAQDWAATLFSMYINWGEWKGHKTNVVDYVEDLEVGITKAILKVECPYAYGILKRESGVHRRVRFSPYGNASGSRQTSFASVQVAPLPPPIEQVNLRKNDLKVETMRSSGPGGQHANTTDSKVRITHIPSGIVVESQRTRSQIENKAICLELICSKLEERKEEGRRKAKQSEYESLEASTWGSQIRNYVFAPYQSIKDTRTKVEVRNCESVLSGRRLDEFLEAQIKL